jgi:DNA-binding NarL/FixJ family response regulator
MNKVGIIEDHPIVAHGVKGMVHLIWKECTVQIFTSFPKIEDELLEIAECEIVIADIHLKDEHILDDLILLQIQKPEQKIVLYTSSHPWELGLQKEDFPFWSYVQKNSDLQALTECLTSVKQKRKHFESDLIWEKTLTDTESVIVLTKREQEILHLIKLGKTSKEIADMLFLSELTVKSHRQNMMRKFDVKNVVELLDRTKNRL